MIVTRSRTVRVLIGVSDLSLTAGRSAFETKGVFSRLAMIVPPVWIHRRRAVEQFGDCRADRLSGVSFVIKKAGTGIDLEAVELAGRRLLEIDAGEEQIERPREPQAGVADRWRQIDGLEPGGLAVEMRVPVIDGVGLDGRREDPLADGVHSDVAARHERLKLRGPVAEQIEARDLAG